MFVGLGYELYQVCWNHSVPFKQKNDNERINIHHFNYISM